MWRYVKFLQIWQKFTFFCIYCVEKAEIPLHVEKFEISPHLSCIEIWNFLHMTDFSPPIYRWSRWQIWGMRWKHFQSVIQRLSKCLRCRFHNIFSCQKSSKSASLRTLTGTRYPTLPRFNFDYPYPTRKSFENFRVQGSNYMCCFHTGLYQWCQLLSSGGKGFSFIISPYTGFRNMKVTICQKHSSWTNTITSCNYGCNF